MLQINRRAALAGAGALALAARTARADEMIVIGAPNAMTGGFGEAGAHVTIGLQLAAEAINEAGGIKALGGARLRVAPADTSSDNPQQAASVARRLIQQDRVVALVGAHAAVMTLAVQVEAERGEVPMLTTSYADAITERGYKYTFKIPAKATLFASLGLDYLVEMLQDARGQKPSRVAVFNGSDASSQALGHGWISTARDRGLQLVSVLEFPAGLSDPTPVIAAVLQSKPEAIFLASFTTDVILITRALRGVGVTVPIVGSGGGVSTNSTGSALGAAGNGLMGTVEWNWDLDIPGVKEIVDRLHRERPNDPYPPAFESLGGGYVAGQVIAAGLEQCGVADPVKLRDAIAGLDLEVVLPGRRLAFDATGLNKYSVPIMVSWLDGQLRTVWPKQYQTTKPVL
jgi:branched-chain amino acid transport system substrate-binding protein